MIKKCDICKQLNNDTRRQVTSFSGLTTCSKQCYDVFLENSFYDIDGKLKLSDRGKVRIKEILLAREVTSN